jgi:hypothetical protein
VRKAAGEAAARARAAGGEAVRVKGPAEAPIAVIRGLHRWQVWLAGIRSDRARGGGAGGPRRHRRRACGWWSTVRPAERALIAAMLASEPIDEDIWTTRWPPSWRTRAGRRRRAVGAPARSGGLSAGGVRLVAGPPVCQRRHRAAVDRRRRPGEILLPGRRAVWCWPAAAATEDRLGEFLVRQGRLSAQTARDRALAGRAPAGATAGAWSPSATGGWRGRSCLPSLRAPPGTSWWISAVGRDGRVCWA